MTEETKHPDWYRPHDRRYKWTPERIKECAESLESWLDKAIKADDNFILSDWCFNSGCGMLPQDLGKYCQRSPEFEAAYRRAKQWQEHRMAKGALLNQFNGKFASMWLAYAHGWKIQQAENENKKLFGDLADFMDVQRQLFEDYIERKKEGDSEEPFT